MSTSDCRSFHAQSGGSSKVRMRTCQMRHSGRAAASLLLGTCAAIAFTAVLPQSSLLRSFVPSMLQKSSQSRALGGLLASTRESAEPRTRLHARARTRRHGGGRRPFNTPRKPVLGSYEDGEEGGSQKQTAAMVIKKAYDRMNLEEEQYFSKKLEFFRNGRERKNFKQDWFCRKGRNLNKRRQQDTMQDEWLRWVRGPGTLENLTTPIIFNGPKLGEMLTEAWDKQTEGTNTMDRQEVMMNRLEDMHKEKRLNDRVMEKGGFRPKDTEPGEWVEDEDSMYNVKKIFGTRALYKFPYDIGQKGTSKVTRGNVY